MTDPMTEPTVTVHTTYVRRSPSTPPYLSQDEYDELDEHDRAEYDRQRQAFESDLALELSYELTSITESFIRNMMIGGTPRLPTTYFG